mmetsp:Transcript_12848/g.1943  ORF Transcript_12848/g.1943 Transcript_12848/m.1943 type:complete len:80 (+) Transcript_12848:626-865(+)
MVNSRSELATRYNDISVLENYHAATLFEILSFPGCNILENLEQGDIRQIRQYIIPMILATDMAKHNEVLTNFNAIKSEY